MSPDVIIDAVLATAIVEHRGSVVLLLPVLRADARKIAARGEKEFVLAVHSMLEGVAADPRFAQAFSQEPRSPISPTSYTPESLCGHRSGLYDAIRAKLSTWRAGIKNRSVRDLKSKSVVGHDTIATPAPTSEPKSAPDANLPTIVSTPVRTIGMNSRACGYTMTLEVSCRDGRLLDAQSMDRGICPFCFGSKA